jgi:hypothetical protein
MEQKKKEGQAFFVVVCIGSILNNSPVNKAIMATSLPFSQYLFSLCDSRGINEWSQLVTKTAISEVVFINCSVP